MRKLYKSNKNRVFAGILGGLGEHFDIDPVILRLFWVFMVIFTGIIPGIIVYLLAMMIVPKKHHSKHHH